MVCEILGKGVSCLLKLKGSLEMVKRTYNMSPKHNRDNILKEFDEVFNELGYIMDIIHLVQ